MSNLVPEGWEIATLSEFASVKGGKRLPKGETFSPIKTKYPYVRVTDFKAGSVDIRGLRYVSESIREQIKRYVISSNDLYISIAGTLGLVGEIPEALDGALLTENAAKIVFNSNSNKTFFKYYLSSNEAQEHFNQAKGTGGGVPKLALFRIEDTLVLIPPLPEQQKIAAILTSVDEVIEKTQAQIDKLKDLKTAMMQTLLTNGVGTKQGTAANSNSVAGRKSYIPHTEFKDSPVGRIPKSWEVVPLSELITVIESGWSPLCEPAKAQTGSWCVLKTTSVTWKGFDYLANKKLPDNLEPRPNIQVVAEDILITRAGPADRVGVVVHVDYCPQKVMLSDKIIRIKTNGRSTSKFLSLWLGGSFAQQYLSSRVSGLASSQTNISQLILSKVPCVLPSLEEQIKIANSLSALDKRIKNVGLKLSGQINLKKALMQDLLTGKVRVKLD